MIDKMDDRRKLKNVNTEEDRKKYNSLSNQIRLRIIGGESSVKN